MQAGRQACWIEIYVRLKGSPELFGIFFCEKGIESYS